MANFYEDLAGGVGSDLESDVSDVNPAEMAKMLQGLDDMDDALFKTHKKQSESKTSSKSTTKKASTSAQAHSVKTDKQHVTFDETTSELPKKKMQPKRKQDEDFDWDDPLGDILSSDESIGKNKSNETAQRKRGTETGDYNQVDIKNVTKDKSQKGKLVADLFSLEETKENYQEKVINKPITAKQSEQPKSLESYLDKKSPQKADNTSLNDEINTSKAWSVSETAMKRTAAESSTFKAKTDRSDSDDLLIGLGLESDKKTVNHLFSGKSNLAKSQSIVDDIFTNPEKKISTNESKKTINKQEPSTDSGISFGNYAPSLSTTRESRRAASKRETSSIGDPLGLFSPPTTPHRNQAIESDQKAASNLPLSTPRRKSGVEINNEDKSDWLGLSVSKEERPHSSPERKRNEKKINKATPVGPEEHYIATPRHHPANNLPEWLGGTGDQNKQSEEGGKSLRHAIAGDSLSNVQSSMQNTAHGVEGERLPTAQGLTFHVQNQMDQEVTFALQLQEQQLRTALQFQQHELQLANVHERQQALLQRQEEQMQQLLTQQAQRQKQMENQLQLQQQKISDYLQALIKQSSTTTILPNLPSNVAPINTASNMEEKSLAKENPENAEVKNEEPSLTDKKMKMHLMEVQITLQQCQLEKKALESTLETLQTKHKEEMHLMEECYRRQVSILDEAMEKHNARLKAENERIEAEYKERFTKIQDHQAVLSENHVQQMAALQKEHISDMQALKNQHTALLEHIKHIQHAETSAVKEASQNMTILQNAVEQLGRNTDNLGEMHEWLEKQSSSQTELRELALKTREAEVQAYKENLARQREAAEEDRKKLLGLVEQLEMQVAQQRSKAEEERYTLRQETVRLDTRIEAFEREKERIKAEIERERQQVEKARQVLLEEQKIVSLQLKDEKLSIAKERARIKALAQLHGAAAASEDEVMKLKAEAEAALTVAKEATDQVEAQKLVLQEQQRQLEKERRHIQDLEHNLTIRARELEALTQTALATRNEGAEALASAVQAEERQKQRAVELQRQLSEVKERERRLSEEKILLSQERMKIHRSQEQKICPSCRGSMLKSAFSAEQSQTEMDSNKFVDPKKIILKLVAEKERDVLLSSSLHSASK